MLETAEHSATLNRILEELRALRLNLHKSRQDQGPAAMTAVEAARYLAVSIRFFEQLVSSGEIPVVRISPRCRRFLREHLDAFLATKLKVR